MITVVSIPTFCFSSVRRKHQMIDIKDDDFNVIGYVQFLTAIKGLSHDEAFKVANEKAKELRMIKGACF